MSVRKRTWFSRSDGEAKAKELARAAGATEERWPKFLKAAKDELSKAPPREAWVVDYIDQDGKRRLKTYATKKEASENSHQIGVDVRTGIHTPESKSITVARAGDDWVAQVQNEGRERSTLAQYRQHLHKHINPRLGNEKLARLTTPKINAFRDDLLKKLSRPLARKVLTSLKSLLSDAQRRGNVAQNVALSVKIGVNKRDKKKLKAGIDIPEPEEVKRLLAEAEGRMRAILVTLVFTGLRASELRGLRWADVALKRGELHVRQRADRYSKIGRPKSESGERTIPVGPFVVNTLREWQLACPASDGKLVFPTSTGLIDHHANILRALAPVQIAAGVTAPVLDKHGKPELDENGKPLLKPKYALHAFRHFFASWCINRKQDGGLELPAKIVQERLGHSSIVMTMDTYGHLFPRNDDSNELAEAEQRLIGA